MTDFGNPSDFAMMCFREAVGDDLERFSRPLPEYDTEELKLLLTCLRLAYKASLKSYGASTAQEMLLAMHDAAFSQLARKSKKFAAFVLNNKHTYVGGHTKAQIKKYKGLVREARLAH